MKNPYSELPRNAYWRSGVADPSPFAPTGIYRKKWQLPQDGLIATAGSCFAQHIARHLRRNGFKVLDAEPAPVGLPPHRHLDFGYSMYSARFGNVYTVHQLLQLAREAYGEFTPAERVWTRDGRFFDAQRPNVEPQGLDSPEQVLDHRAYHLSRVREMLASMDVLIFTLGLTECWRHKASGTVYPTAPGTIAGEYSEHDHEFKNFSYPEILTAFAEFEDLIKRRRQAKPLKIILTVSPVPLVASASGHHVLSATTYSKSTLRAVAGDLSACNEHIDYFPSFEIITNPSARSIFYENNLRSVRSTGVETVMSTFFAEHKSQAADHTPAETTEQQESPGQNGVMCEEAMLEAFGNGN